MIKLGGLVNLKPITEADVYTATSKETGTTSVFKSKDARDAAVKAGTHEKRKDDKDGAQKDPTEKPKVNIFNKPKKDKEEPKSKPNSDTPKTLPFDDDTYEEIEGMSSFDDLQDFAQSKEGLSDEQRKQLQDLAYEWEDAEGEMVMGGDDEADAEYQRETSKITAKAMEVVFGPEDNWGDVDNIEEPKSSEPSSKKLTKKSVEGALRGDSSEINNFLDDNESKFSKEDFEYLKKQSSEIKQMEDELEKAKSEGDQEEVYDLESDIGLTKSNLDNTVFDMLGDENIEETTSTKLKHLLPEGLINEGTRSQVGIIDRSGKIASGYVHFDGYPSNMKPGIKKHMKNEKDVLTLIKKGGARGIYNDKPVEFYNEKPSPIKGNFKDIPKYLNNAGNKGGAEYVYLYNMKDRKWYFADVYDDTELKKLLNKLIADPNSNISS